MQHNGPQQQQEHPHYALHPQRHPAAQSHTLPTRHHQQRALRQDPSFHLRQLHPNDIHKVHNAAARQRHHQGFASRTLPNSASKRERALAAAGYQCTCSSASSSSHASPSKVTRPRSLEFANGASQQQPMPPPQQQQTSVEFDDSSSAMSALNYGSSSDAGPLTPETVAAPMVQVPPPATARLQLLHIFCEFN